MPTSISETNLSGWPCAHVACRSWKRVPMFCNCCHDGRVETLLHTINIMDEWLTDAGTEPALQGCLVEYARGRGGVCHGIGEINTLMADNQDQIGWQRFMKGMVCKKICGIQEAYSMIKGTHTSAAQWTTGLILKLLEITHGQWLHHNVQVHDAFVGTRTTLWNEQLQHKIEHQMELGVMGLLQEDKYLMEINFEDMESTSCKRQEYWLLESLLPRRRKY
jgi:hypothetical protein